MGNIFDIFKSIENEKADIKTGAPEKVIAFLGNPGTQYARTRHNAGFMLADFISEKENVKIDRARFKALTAEAMLGGKKVLLIKPQTYMNLSGDAVREALSFYKLEADKDLIVIYDDIYLDAGKLRIREKGSDGGHNGIKSIIYQTGTDGFKRIRVGVGKPPKGYSMPDWVLGNIPERDQKAFFESLARAYSALLLMIADKTEEAMNKYNG